MSTDDTPPPVWWSPTVGLVQHSELGHWRAVNGRWQLVLDGALPADAVELRPVPAVDPSARIDVYVKARNIMDVGLVTEEIADGVNVDWWTDHKGDQYIAGVEVLAARSVTIDGQRVTPAPAAPDTADDDESVTETPMPCQITVFCDRCGIEATHDYWVHEEDDGPTRLGVARAHMRTNERWSCDERGDFCPEHIPAARSLTTEETRTDA